MAKKKELEQKIAQLEAEANQGKTTQQTVEDLANLKLDVSGSHPKKVEGSVDQGKDKPKKDEPKKGFTGFPLFQKKEVQDPKPKAASPEDKVQKEISKLANEPDEEVEPPKKAESVPVGLPTLDELAENDEEFAKALDEIRLEAEPTSAPAVQPKAEAISEESTELAPRKCTSVARVNPVACDPYRADGPGKAYKYWNYRERFWMLTEDFWVARQLGGDLWDIVWVWYQDGAIHHVMTEKEIQRYLP